MHSFCARFTVPNHFRSAMSYFNVVSTWCFSNRLTTTPPWCGDRLPISSSKSPGPRDLEEWLFSGRRGSLGKGGIQDPKVGDVTDNRMSTIIPINTPMSSFFPIFWVNRQNNFSRPRAPRKIGSLGRV